MSRTPQKLTGSRAYREAWRAVNLLIRSDGSWSGRERDVCYHNSGDGTFTDASYVTGLDSAGDGRGFVTLDLNGDGALDIVEASRTAPRVRVMENGVAAAAAVMVELRGSGRSNRDAIGATAVMETSTGRKLLRLVQAGSGYLTESSRRLHFALLAGERAQRLTIRWPGGGEETLADIPGTGTFRVVEGGGRFEPLVAGAALPRTAQKDERTPSIWLVEPVPAPAMRGVAGSPGRLTLLNFWGSWCPPCREEFKEWTSAAGSRRLAAAGLRVVIAVVDEDASQRPPASAFAVVRPSANEMTAWNLFHRHLFDRRRDIGLPTSFLLDESGRVLKVYSGMTATEQLAADAAIAPAARRSFPFAGRWLGERPKRNPVELATALAESGLPAESARYFELALRKGNASREAMNNYAGVLSESGDLARAEKLLVAALGSGEHEEDVLANLGSLRLRQGRNGEAKVAFEKVLAKSPDDAMALNGLGSVLFAGQDVAGARDRFAAAVRADPENAGYRYNWASALAAGGEFGPALHEFEAVRERQGDSAKLANNLGILYVETGATGKGEAAFRKAIELAPREVGGYMNLATLYVKMNRAGEARETLRALLRVSPGQAEAVRLLGTLGR